KGIPRSPKSRLALLDAPHPGCGQCTEYDAPTRQYYLPKPSLVGASYLNIGKLWSGCTASRRYPPVTFRSRAGTRFYHAGDQAKSDVIRSSCNIFCISSSVGDWPLNRLAASRILGNRWISPAVL